jgi:hypothetical protein
MSRHLPQTSAHLTIVVLTIEEGPRVITKQRHALLGRKDSIDERWIVVSEICKDEMLCSILTM